MYIEELKKELTGRKLEVWLGTASGISEQKMLEYRNRWIKEANPNKTQDSPSLFKKAINFGKALVDHALSGFKTLNDEEYKKRIDICNSCEFLSESKSCNKCGCNIELKAKWAEQECPEKKWPLPIVENTVKKGGCGCTKSSQ